MDKENKKLFLIITFIITFVFGLFALCIFESNETYNSFNQFIISLIYETIGFSIIICGVFNILKN